MDKEDIEKELKCIVKDLDSSIKLLKFENRVCFIDELESLKNRLEILFL